MEWFSHFIPGNAPDGAPILSVLGKRTYVFENGKPAREAEEQDPFLEADEYWNNGKPQSDPVKLESDLAPYKPMTDVILLAKAHVPGGRPLKQLDVGVQVGTARKVARVFGDRKAFVTGTGIGFTEPEPFVAMPLDYSRAYGGKDAKSDEGFNYAYLKNAVGRGFVVKDHPKAVQDLALPNIEDPQKLLSPLNLVVGAFDKWKHQPDPMGFGYVNKGFHPRFTFAGLPPEHWVEAEADRKHGLKKAPEIGSKPGAFPPSQAPMLNPRFFNGASKGLSFPYLKGDETIKLAHLDPAIPQFSFSLPGVCPRAWLDVGQGPEEMAMVLHTVVVDMEKHRMTMVWRGCSYYGGLEAMKGFTNLEYGVKEDRHG
ncbi:MAG: DUF2169 domain-containing protein [Fibrobacterota bacterium]|nr:DUF2169 domain-containing protein [Fibrobacterota bacterium]